MSQEKRDQLVALMQEEMPLNVTLKVQISVMSGLIIVDVVRGFCAPGGGNLAPPGHDVHVEKMVKCVEGLASRFQIDGLPVFVLREEHIPGKLEQPYPPHCEKGSGEEELMHEIAWLERYSRATILPKSCISGYVAATRKDGTNMLVDWVNDNKLEDVVVVGICTDICDLQVVHPLLSARNLDMMPSLKRVIAYMPGCGTYDLPKESAVAIGLPEFLAHPRGPAQHMGFYLMQMSGVVLARGISM